MSMPVSMLVSMSMSIMMLSIFLLAATTLPAVSVSGFLQIMKPHYHPRSLITSTPLQVQIQVRAQVSKLQMSNENTETKSHNQKHKHTLAILSLPQTSIDRIANEAILETCMKNTSHKLSIVLRCQDNHKPKLHELRGYVGEIYSMAWDVALGIYDNTDDTSTNSNESDTNSGESDTSTDNTHEQDKSELLNVIIYPQNLPNAAPESWITHRPDLNCICSHSSIIGWVSNTSHGSGKFFESIEGSGIGGLQSHVDAVNVDRKSRGLDDVVGLDVENWPEVCKNGVCDFDDNVVFLEDDYTTASTGTTVSTSTSAGVSTSTEEMTDSNNNDNINNNINDDDISSDAIGRYRIPSSSLYNSVAVGGTWDGVHYGHRKLLTLAISSVVPNGGKLIIGITTDEMLQQKDLAELIPPLKERIKGVRNFIDDLAPGMKNRVKIIPIKDAYGPPGSSPDSNVYDIENDFDALVLSHETLPTGKKLNQYRCDSLGMEPLKLLCTRRTEAHGMSSTVLRRIRNQQS